MTRATAILVGALTAVLLMAVPALAQYPPAEGSTATVDSTAVLAGGTVAVAGEGWQPGSTVSFSIVSTGADLGTAPVDGDGEFATSVTIPASTPAGAQTLRVSGTGADGAPRTVDIAVTVDGDDDGSGTAGSGAAGSGTAGSGTAGGGALASTGGPVTFSTTTALGALLLVIGAGALFASRRLTRVGAHR